MGTMVLTFHELEIPLLLESFLDQKQVYGKMVAVPFSIAAASVGSKRVSPVFSPSDL